MKLPTVFLVTLSPFVPAQELLFRDNFDAPDSNNLDLSVQAGRRSGLNPNIQVRSSRIQHGIVANQLNFLTVRTGRLRFQRDPDQDNTTPGDWYPWSDVATASAILDGGGMRVAFDWIAGNDTSNNWIAINLGISGPGSPEPGFRVNHPETDVGMLFRFSGETQLFDNGLDLGAQGSFAPTVGVRHVVMDFAFDSFEDGSDVEVTASVDGTEVFSGGGFTWDNNLGELYLEIGTLENTLLDNLEVSGLLSDQYSFQLGGNLFSSGAPQGTVIGDLSGSAEGAPDPSTFTLVAGEGDADNAKFQINGSQLEVGNFDFTGNNASDGQEYTVRVRGVGTGTAERILILRVVEDDDFDALSDAWENRWATSLDDLSGGASGQDFDQDGLTDAAEFTASVRYPDIDPTTADSDGDGLSDGEELNPEGTRLETDPTNPDTDLDGLSDAIESNGGAVVDETDSGTDPTRCDTDGDFATDAWEVSRGTDPLDPAQYPPPAGPVTIVPITDEASTGIDPEKNYTHLVSGGISATVNGVFFEALTPNQTPPDFAWDPLEGSRSEVISNNGGWDVAGSGVSPAVQDLLASFTYSGTGPNPGNRQRFTLSNLIPGNRYDLRLYSRTWAPVGSGRAIDLVFENGDERVEPFRSLPQDRPGLTTGSGLNSDAFYLSYQYTAQTSELVIDAAVPLCAPANSGSFHLYALSNEFATGRPPGEIRITGHTLTADRQLIISFEAKPQTSYELTGTSALDGEFLPLSPARAFTTDPSGVGQATVSLDEEGAPRRFYRLEE